MLKRWLQRCLSALAALGLLGTVLVVTASPASAWTPYTIVAQSAKTVGSVTAIAEIRRGTEVNRYYTRVSCYNTNTQSTVVRAYDGSSYSWNIAASLGFISRTPYGNPTVVGYSSQYVAFNDWLRVYGDCEYVYNGHGGHAVTPWSDWVWVGSG